MKPIEIDAHTRHRMALRGTTDEEVTATLREAKWEGAQNGRLQCRKSFAYGKLWIGKSYNTKQVKVIFNELEDVLVVDTVYVFYF